MLKVKTENGVYEIDYEDIRLLHKVMYNHK